MNEKILLIADTHCRFDLLEKIIQHEKNIACVLHCGDLGIYDIDQLSRLTQRERYLIERHSNPVHLFKPYLKGEKIFSLPIYGIPGNHEDFTLVDMFVQKNVSVENLHVFGQGEIIEIQSFGKKLTILGLGKMLPERAKLKKKPKIIQKEDLEKALKNGRNRHIDILLLHEPPILQTEKGGRFGSIAIRELIEQIQPSMIFAGHMHFEYKTQILASCLYGLGYGIESRYAILYSDMSVEFKTIEQKDVLLKEVMDVPSEIIGKVKDSPRKKKQKQTILPITAKEILEEFGLERKKNLC